MKFEVVMADEEVQAELDTYLADRVHKAVVNAVDSWDVSQQIRTETQQKLGTHLSSLVDEEVAKILPELSKKVGNAIDAAIKSQVKKALK